ncbi:MarR family winged helix-turn-helix transcriptional regulator [Reyranella sp.]|uniref:MarR family winged helix-turn-helix transcriptional regulator n=1 Tax=Reyranella sp. TaxID=1929291 RepID=UPI002F941390
MNRTNGAARRVAGHAAGVRPEAASPSDRDAVHLGPLAGLIGFHLRRAQTASFQAFAHRVGQTDLSAGTFALLTLIRHNPGISQTALSRADGRDKSSLTPALNALERRGLIVRQRLPSNRRTYALSLTSAGADILGELGRHASTHDRNLDRIVGLEHKAMLIRLLRRIATELAGAVTDDDVPGAVTPRHRARRGSSRSRGPARGETSNETGRER